MIKFFRNIRKTLVNEGKTSKYLKYAIGEIVLIVVGILIALQINNWNKEKSEQIELYDLLITISEELKEDQIRLKELQEARIYISDICSSIKPLLSKSSDYKFDISEVRILLTAILSVQNEINYQPHRSAYDVLKSSIYVTKIKSKDLNKLLNSYYYNVDRLIKQEELFNTSLQKNIDSFKGMLTQKSENADYNLYDITNNLNKINWEIVEDRQDWYKYITNNSSTEVLIDKGIESTSFIEQYYDLITIGEQLIIMIEENKDNLDKEAEVVLDRIINIYNHKNNQLIVDGYITRYFVFKPAYVQYFGQNFYPSNHDNPFLIFEYPKNNSDLNWTAFGINVSSITGTVNFSKYQKLIIEAKGDIGGEKMDIVVKDILDPVDGSESRFKLELTNSWKKYEIDLKHFETANLNNVQVALGFVFVGKTARKIYVKNAYYQ